MNDIVIELKHLKKYYGFYKGIEDVSFKINKGEICCGQVSEKEKSLRWC